MKGYVIAGVLIIGMSALITLFLLNHKAKPVDEFTLPATSHSSVAVAGSSPVDDTNLIPGVNTSTCVNEGDIKIVDGVAGLCKTVYMKGMYTTNPIDIPDNATMMLVSTSRDNYKLLPGTKDIIHISADVYDGRKWITNYYGFTTTGGSVFDKQGLELNASSVEGPIVDGVGRKVQLVIDAQEDLVSAMAVSFT